MTRIGNLCGKRHETNNDDKRSDLRKFILAAMKLLGEFIAILIRSNN